MNLEFLENIPLFKDLPIQVLEKIASVMTLEEFPPDTIVFREGDAGDDFYVVLSGQLEVIKSLGTPDERLIASRGPGEFIGELSLVNPDGLRTATVRTHGPTQLWRMSHQDFDQLLHQHAALGVQMVRVLGFRLTSAHNLSIQDLHEKNVQLQKAYDELKAAQEQIIEKERLERELQVAYEIQKSILPQELPQVPEYDFGRLMSPARAVGGDFYDVFVLDEDRIGVVIGDVTDKGVPSAIFMAQTHALMYAEATRCHTPLEVLARANHHLMRMGASKLFATVLYGVLNRQSKTFSYARGGHELPLVRKQDQPVFLMPWKRGQPIGLLPAPLFDEQTIELIPDTTIFLYTDGISDCRNPAGEFFGLERVKDLLAELAGQPAQALCDQIWERLARFQSGAMQDDDVTMLAIQTKEAQP